MNRHLCSPAPALALATLCAFLNTAPTRSHAGTEATPSAVPDSAAVTKISSELYQALDPKKRATLAEQPVTLTQTTTPSLAPAQSNGSGQSANTVQLSTGSLEFIAQLAHARAIAETDKGFVKKYAAALAEGTAEQPLPDFGKLSGGRGADFDTRNFQTSQFNQMVGSLLAINLAHHYLGHFKKCSPQLKDGPGQPVPISTLLTEKEWNEAVLKGARNALDCGLGVEGLRTVFDCFASMPQRPAWSASFIHAKADVKKLSRELERMERDFFLVEK